jgi:hypothetical protein
LVIAVVAFLGIPLVLLMRKGKPPTAAAATKPALPLPVPVQQVPEQQAA